MDVIVEIIRIMTALTGTALLGRLVRDRATNRIHFHSEAAKIRWWMMVLFTGTITLSGFLAAIAKPEISLASLGQLAGLIAISVGHYYRDTLRTSEEAESAEFVNAANNRLNNLINK